MSSTPRADLWFSVVLIAFGTAAVVESWRMPRLENLGIDPLSAPGLTPGLLALVITGLGLTLFLRSLRSLRATAPVPESAPGGWGRLALALTLCLVYALGLVGRADFFLATTLFVFSFTLLFADPGQSWPRRAAGAAILALGTASAVTLLFERVFLIRLP